MERICAPAPGVKRRRKQTPDSGAIQGAQEIHTPQPENRGKKLKKIERPFGWSFRDPDMT